MYNLNYTARTDVGRNRDINEDSYLAKDNIFAVADGMGGHLAGEVASDIALNAVQRNLKKINDPPEQIKHAFKIANSRVINYAKRNIGHYGMGTTLTLALLNGEDLWIGHIGDSRAYLFSKGKLKQITEDHSLVAHLVKQGEINAQEADHHPKRHVITKAIGSQPAIDPDIFSIKIGKGDRLLLCTDGLTTMLEDGEILTVINNPDPSEAAKELVARANTRGGHDNITVVIADIGEPRAATETGSKKRRLPLLFLTGLIVVILLFKGALYGVKRVYFLGLYRQKVAIYRGLPVRIWGHSFYKLAEPTDIPLKKLPNYYRQRIKHGIVVGGLTKTRATLKDIASLKSK